MVRIATVALMAFATSIFAVPFDPVVANVRASGVKAGAGGVGVGAGDAGVGAGDVGVGSDDTGLGVGDGAPTEQTSPTKQLAKMYRSYAKTLMDLADQLESGDTGGDNGNGTDTGSKPPTPSFPGSPSLPGGLPNSTASDFDQSSSKWA